MKYFENWRNSDLLKDPIVLCILNLMESSLVCGVFQQIYNLSDGIIVGTYIGDEATAIINGSSTSLINLFNSVYSGVGFGALALAAYFVGSGNTYRISTTLKTAMKLCLILSGAFIVLYMIFSPQALRFLQVPEASIEATAQYVRIYSLSFPAFSLFQTAIRVMNATGASKAATRLLILSFVVNSGLEFLFVGVLKWEQTGVALAYILTQTTGALLSYFPLRELTQIPFLKEKADARLEKSILKIAVPAALSSIGFTMTTTLIQSSMNMLGSAVITSYAIYNKIEKILWIVLDGVGTAVATMVAQNNGARHFERVKKSIFAGTMVSLFSAVGISAVIMLLRKPLIGMFTTDGTVSMVTEDMILFMGWFFAAYLAIDSIQNAMRCLGYSLASTVIIITTVLMTRSLYIVLYAWKHLSYRSILTCYPVSWILASGAYILYYLLVVKKSIGRETESAV